MQLMQLFNPQVENLQINDFEASERTFPLLHSNLHKTEHPRFSPYFKSLLRTTTLSLLSFLFTDRKAGKEQKEVLPSSQPLKCGCDR